MSVPGHVPPRAQAESRWFQILMNARSAAVGNDLQLHMVRFPFAHGHYLAEFALRALAQRQAQPRSRILLPKARRR